MNLNEYKVVELFSNVVIIYCLHLPVALVFALFGFSEIYTFLNFSLPGVIGVTFYLIFLPIVTFIVVVESIGKFKRKERFTRWGKFRLIGSVLVFAWSVVFTIVAFSNI